MRLMITAFTAASAAALAFAWLAPGHEMPAGPAAKIETVGVPQAAEFRLPGEYLVNGRAVEAPLQTAALRPGVEMMKFQVTLANYTLCVEAGACEPADAAPLAGSRQALPVTGVSYRDAVAYAAWLSDRTGENWRLPTDDEWAAAAGERLTDERLELAPEDDDNPAARWLARYRSEAARGRDAEPKPLGHYGENSQGFADMGGNVWEWTATCFTRTTLGDDGSVRHMTENCGVRVVGGSHRAYMSHFVRDGKSGGCAAGLPPDNLGIRLVRDRTSIAQYLRHFWMRTVG